MAARSLVAAAAVLAGSAGLASAAPILFAEDFSVAQSSSVNADANSTGPVTTIATSYGSRSLNAYIMANSAPNDAHARAAIEGGAFTYSSDEPVYGTGFVTYSFASPVDLSTTKAFAIRVLDNDRVGSVLITAYDADGKGNENFPPPPLPIVTDGSPQTIVVPFVFDPSGQQPDRRRIVSLRFGFGDANGEDLTIDSIASVVPEPASLAGVAAVLGLVVRRRRIA